MNEDIQKYIESAVRSHFENRHDDCREDALIAIAMSLLEIAKMMDVEKQEDDTVGGTD